MNDPIESQIACPGRAGRLSFCTNAGVILPRRNETIKNQLAVFSQAFDAQYSHLEYQYKQGWGHSAMDDTVKFAELAEVKHLLLGHHDPSHSDTDLNGLLEELKKKNDYSFRCELAAKEC
ncbi:MAG: hypothetical protein ABIT05_12910 [Chitinophagaceae bacterium]